MSRYALLAACTEPWPVQFLCRVLAVSPAGYYQWRQKSAAVPAPCRAAAQAAFTRHARRYCTRRLRAELHAEGHAVGRYALRTWRHRHHLQALGTRPHRPRTTVADPAAIVAENRLLGPPAPAVPNRVWVGDITYLPLAGGRWCYLAIWRDACSQRVVGWHLAARMPTGLVLHTLEQALTLRQRAPGLIAHANRGSQYTSAACRARVAQAGAVPGLCDAVIPTTTPYRVRPRRSLASVPSKPNCCPTALLLPTLKKPAWRQFTTLTPTSTSNAATLSSATARPNNSNTT